jgi:hypothetical protein
MCMLGWFVVGLRASRSMFLLRWLFLVGEGCADGGSHFGEWWKVDDTVVVLSVSSTCIVECGFGAN